jgi:hypothetical protein
MTTEKRMTPSPRTGPVCDDTPAVAVRVGHPRVRPHVVPMQDKTTPLTRADIVTSFIVVWQPSPPPPPLWVKFLQSAPFGTQLIRASDLRWDGKFLSIELVNEADIDAFASQMPQWVEYANNALSQCERSPAALALKEAQDRALVIENRLRK